MIIPFSDTGIIISSSNFILSLVTVRTALLVIFFIGLFNFLQVCMFIIDRSESESNWNLTGFDCYVFTNDIVWLVLAFCMSDSVFNYFSVSTLRALMSEFIPVLRFFLYDRDSLWPNILFLKSATHTYIH